MAIPLASMTATTPASAIDADEARVRMAAYLRACALADGAQAQRLADHLHAGACARGAAAADQALAAGILWTRAGVAGAWGETPRAVPRERTTGMPIQRFVDPVEAGFLAAAGMLARLRRRWLRVRRVVFG